MSKPKLAPLSSFRKSYKFLWLLTFDMNFFDYNSPVAQTVQSIVGNIDSISKAINAVKNNIKTQDSLTWIAIQQRLFTDYVSQLAKSVKLPDDSLEVENYNIGWLEYPVIKGKKLDNIEVTYYDDSFSSVYSFHKAWMNLSQPSANDIGNERTMSFFPFSNTYQELIKEKGTNKYPTGITARASYIEFENDLTSSEIKLPDLSAQAANYLSGVEDFLLDTITDFGMKYTTIQNFPLIFPISITRSGGDKTSTGLSEVTVTYIRIPEVSNLIHKPLTSKNNYGFGENL